jgi:exopolysaccharide biosynthesis predicted pyruvyltransferase EpsI
MNIHDYFKCLPKTGLWYSPNPGNAGDNLIAHATFQLFRLHGIQYRIVDWSMFQPSGKWIIFGGGGSLTPDYTHVSTQIKTSLATADRITILPHSISGHIDLLEHFGSNVDLICRESVSYQHAQRYALKANLLLMDDLALSLDLADTFGNRPIGYYSSFFHKVLYSFVNIDKRDQYPSPSLMLRVKSLDTRLRELSRDRHHSINVLYSFRTDEEKTSHLFPADNLDLSAILAFGVSSERVAHLSSYMLLRLISYFDEVHTNRLHISIAAAILGKKVKIYPNSYHKCMAVYEYSLKGKFPNVEWHG